MTDLDSKNKSLSSSLLLLLASTGIVSGMASALYLHFNREPLLLQLTVHGLIFASGYIILYKKVKVNNHTKSIVVYMAGALPLHILIHIIMIRDVAIPFTP